VEVTGTQKVVPLWELCKLLLSVLLNAIIFLKKGIARKSNNIESIKDCPNLFVVKVLLVEDNEINQEVASIFLKKANIEVDIANNGFEKECRFSGTLF
jgi:hypothetical protein